MLQVGWQGLVLDSEERNAFCKLLQRVSYLGRAESWVDASLAEFEDGHLDVIPCNGESQDGCGDAVRLLVCPSASEFVTWRDGYLAASSSTAQNAAGKRRMRELPTDLWEVLNTDTAILQRHGWSAPPGTRWVP